MIETDTLIFCKCGSKYHHLVALTLPLSKELQLNSMCPKCGADNKAKYIFDVVCSFDIKCYDISEDMIPIGEIRPKKYCISDHFLYNKGMSDEELFPRICANGHQVLLKQRRIF